MNPSHFYPASQWVKMGIQLTIDKVGGSEMKIETLGIDLAKSVFHLYGVDAYGKALMKKRLSRKKLLEFMANLAPCRIGMEACGGAHYWSRAFRKLGHEVKLLPPQYVKPYVKTNKNNYSDAEAICEAMSRPNMRFVGIKSVDQQDIQSLHRVRACVWRAATGGFGWM